MMSLVTLLAVGAFVAVLAHFATDKKFPLAVGVLLLCLAFLLRVFGL